MPLPPFSFETSVTPEDARQDKVEIGIEGAAIIGDLGDAQWFIDHLGPPPTHQRQEPTSLESYGRYFCRYQEFLRSQVIFKALFRDQPFRIAEHTIRPPLCGGYLVILSGQEISQEQGQHDDSVRRWPIGLLLSLNPTQFVRHQLFSLRFRESDPDRFFAQFQPDIWQRNVREPHNEHSLMRSKNWLPDETLWNPFISDSYWPRLLQDCLRLIPQGVVAELERVGGLLEATAARLEANWRYNLHSAETYWEFACEDPLGVVERLRGLAETYGQSVEPQEAEEHQYSRVVRRSTRNGEILKIYAKTDRRIRFEVVHQLRGTNSFRLPRGRGHTFNSTNDIENLLNYLASEAADIVNEILRHFQSRASVPQDQYTVLKLIADFQYYCQDPEKAFRLLQILTHFGYIDVGNNICLATIKTDL